MNNYNLPDPGKYNATQSEELLHEVVAALKAYFNDPSMLVHIRNAGDAVPETIIAIMDTEIGEV